MVSPRPESGKAVPAVQYGERAGTGKETGHTGSSLTVFLARNYDKYAKLVGSTVPGVQIATQALDEQRLNHISGEDKAKILVYYIGNVFIPSGGEKYPNLLEELGLSHSTMISAIEAVDYGLHREWDAFQGALKATRTAAKDQQTWNNRIIQWRKTIEVERMRYQLEAIERSESLHAEREAVRRDHERRQQELAKKRAEEEAPQRRREDMIARMREHGFTGTLADLNPMQLALADIVLPDEKGELTWDQIKKGLRSFRNDRSDIAFYDAIRKAAWVLEQHEGIRKGEITDRQHWQSNHHYQLIIATKKQLIAAEKPNDIQDIAAQLGWAPGTITHIVHRHHDTLDWSIPYAKMGALWETVARGLMEERGITDPKLLPIDEAFAARMNAQIREEFGDRAPKDRTPEDYAQLWAKVREETTLGRRRTAERVTDEMRAEAIRLYRDTTMPVADIAAQTGIAEGSVRAYASKAGVRRGQTKN